MRAHLSVVGLFALLLSAPAAADVTVRYAPDPPSNRGLLIEADGRGRIRAETGPGELFIMRDGVTYVVTPGEEGPRVSRLEDFLVVATEAASAFRRSHPMRTTPPEMHYRLSERGPQTVGIWPGTRVDVVEVGSRHPQSNVEWVASSDPALAEAGQAANWLFETQSRILATVIWHPSELITLLRQLRERGTPLRLGGQYRLESVSVDLVPVSRFDLPGPVLSQAQLRALQPH
jgi:hypothetical protein